MTLSKRLLTDCKFLSREDATSDQMITTINLLLLKRLSPPLSVRTYLTNADELRPSYRLFFSTTRSTANTFLITVQGLYLPKTIFKFRSLRITLTQSQMSMILALSPIVSQKKKPQSHVTRRASEILRRTTSPLYDLYATEFSQDFSKPIRTSRYYHNCSPLPNIHQQLVRCNYHINIMPLITFYRTASSRLPGTPQATKLQFA